jgi:hypothetical protein
VFVVHGWGVSMGRLELFATHLNKVAIQYATDKTNKNDN